MAQTYTLDEAATRLGIAQEELKRRLRDDWKSIRSFRDGATLRFRSSDIDDLARTLGQASDPVLQPGDKKAGTADEFLLPPGDSDSSNEMVFSSTVKKGKKPGDSDLRLDGTSGPRHDPNENLPTEEISLDVSGPGSKPKGPGSGKLSAPKSGSLPKSGTIKGPNDSAIMNTDSSSEFELSLDSDSDSFELDLNTGSGEKAPLAAKSGITLDKPADGGVSLNDSDESLDFELALDAPPKSKTMPKPKKAQDSDSEFELALDDNSGVTDHIADSIRNEEKGDIFETDFEMPAVDDSGSGSEVVAVDSSDLAENSDFDLALDESDVQVDDEESASQVVLIDEEEEAPSKSGRRQAAGAAVTFDDDSDTGSASRALRDVDDEEAVRVVQTTGPKWGAMPAVMGFITLPFIFLGTIMGFELVRGMSGYNQPGKASGPVIKGVASMLGMTPNEKN